MCSKCDTYAFDIRQVATFQRNHTKLVAPKVFRISRIITQAGGLTQHSLGHSPQVNAIIIDRSGCKPEIEDLISVPIISVRVSQFLAHTIKH